MKTYRPVGDYAFISDCHSMALVSRTVRDLVAGSDIALEDRGTHTLKGLSDPWHLFAAT